MLLCHYGGCIRITVVLLGNTSVHMLRRPGRARGMGTCCIRARGFGYSFSFRFSCSFTLTFPRCLERGCTFPVCDLALVLARHGVDPHFL